MATERYPVGTRGVLVQDHRWSPLPGLRRGLTGVVVEFRLEYERLFSIGGYLIQFDNSSRTEWVNASAVAERDNGYSDNDLVMAGDLANLVDAEWPYADWYAQSHVSRWLRSQMLHELKARTRS